MPIVGLTNQQPSFPQLGSLRKGTAKINGGMGKDLGDHFRFDTSDASALVKFSNRYGDKPNGIEVYLPFATTDENWEAWIEMYGTSGLTHRCDRDWIVRELRGSTYQSYEVGQVACPGHPPKDGSKAYGRLRVIVPVLERLAYVMVLTNSLNDCKNLDDQLRAAEQSARALGKDLRGVPFILSRRLKRVSTPGFGKNEGQRQRVDKWLLSIEVAPQYVARQLSAMAQLALPGSTLLALPDGGGMVEQATGQLAGPVTLVGTVTDFEAKRNSKGALALRFKVLGQTVIATNGIAEEASMLANGAEVTVVGESTELERIGPCIKAESIVVALADEFDGVEDDDDESGDIEDGLLDELAEEGQLL